MVRSSGTRWQVTDPGGTVTQRRRSTGVGWSDSIGIGTVVIPVLSTRNERGRFPYGRGVLAGWQSFDGQRGFVWRGAPALKCKSQAVEFGGNLNWLLRRKSVPVQRQVQTTAAEHGMETLAYAVAGNDADDIVGVWVTSPPSAIRPKSGSANSTVQAASIPATSP